jgi:hypothetical protein
MITPTGVRLGWGRGIPLSLVVLALPFAFACGSDGLTPPPLADENTLYWDLQLSHHAVTLSTTAPFDTLSLVAIPRNHRGEPLTGLPAPQYTSSDLEHVLVTAKGVLVAVAPTSQLVVITATLTTGNLKHEDKVFVKVVDNPTPPVLASLSIHPVPPDSAKTTVMLSYGNGLDLTSTLPVHATDSGGDSIPDLPVYFSSSDPSVAGIGENSGDVNAVQPGSVTFYGTTTAFGITKTDTLLYRIGWPLVSIVLVNRAAGGMGGNTFVDAEIKVGVGAVVIWNGQLANASEPMDVTFDDPTNVAALNAMPISSRFDRGSIQLLILCYFSDCNGVGNFVLQPPPPDAGLGGLGFAARGFPVPGTYDYHSANGAHGRIIVIDER